MISARISGWRSAAMNMCSVRQRPIPSAPNSRARAASSGVSALARTRSRRSSSDHSSTVSRCSSISASRSGTSAVVMTPAEPSIASRSPAWSTVSPTVTVFASRSISSVRAPQTHGLAHAAGDQRRVRGLAALRGDDPARRVEAGDVLGLGERADQDHVAALGAGAAIASAEVKTISPLAAPGEAATPRASTSNSASGAKVGWRRASSAFGVDRRQRRPLVEQPLGDRVDGEADRGLRRALGAPRLQHEEAVLLDRELGVLHVAVVGLERAQDLEQLGVRGGHHVGHLGQVARGADAGDDVLALGVDEEVAARLGPAGDLVAGEGDARARALALVAEDHLLDVDRGAPVLGDAVDPPVLDRAGAAPGVEDGADRGPQLVRAGPAGTRSPVSSA